MLGNFSVAKTNHKLQSIFTESFLSVVEKIKWSRHMPLYNVRSDRCAVSIFDAKVIRIDSLNSTEAVVNKQN